MKLLLVVLACIGIALAYVAVVLATPVESEFCNCAGANRVVTTTLLYCPEGVGLNTSRCMTCGKVVRR